MERLLTAADAAASAEAWQEFCAEYSRLILHVARQGTDSYDMAMDRYAYVLEQLRADDFRRLRAYSADGRGKFTTWLVVVVRRLCHDEARRRYGRRRGDTDTEARRRNLVDLMGADLDLDLLPDEQAVPPGEVLVESEAREALDAAIRDLDPADRLLLRLRFQDDLAVAEIARLLSLPSVFHVYRRLNRIYTQLRTALRGLGIEDAAL